MHTYIHKGPFKLKRAICRPERAMCWPDKPFVRLRGPSAGLKGPSFDKKGSFRPKTSLCWPESSLCYPEMAFYWSKRAPFGPRWHFVGQREARSALRGPCQPELALNWPVSSLYRPEFDLRRPCNAPRKHILEGYARFFISSSTNDWASGHRPGPQCVCIQPQ